MRVAVALGLEIKAKCPHVQSFSMKSFKLSRVTRSLKINIQHLSTHSRSGVQSSADLSFQFSHSAAQKFNFFSQSTNRGSLVCVINLDLKSAQKNVGGSANKTTKKRKRDLETVIFLLDRF